MFSILPRPEKSLIATVTRRESIAIAAAQAAYDARATHAYAAFVDRVTERAASGDAAAQVLVEEIEQARDWQPSAGDAANARHARRCLGGMVTELQDGRDAPYWLVEALRASLEDADLLATVDA